MAFKMYRPLHVICNANCSLFTFKFIEEIVGNVSKIQLSLTG